MLLAVGEHPVDGGAFVPYNKGRFCSEGRQPEAGGNKCFSEEMMMKKTSWFSLILALCVLLSGLAAAETAPFAYEHDPRENAGAMKDIVVNPDAVYGFSPNPESVRLGEYADAIDWTDPAQVAEARAQRQAYHDSLSELYRMIESMLHEVRPVEEIARAVSTRRNELRLEVYGDDAEGLALVKKSNLETYGNEMGPTPDQLYEKYGSWQTVLEKALGTNAGMDACLGFYDEMYDMYDIGAASEPAESGESLILDRMVVLSRHNIRSPLGGSGSLLGDITPHEWVKWTSNPSELSLRGAVLEIMMGQYFRLYLEKEGLFPENYQPEDGEVRIYANAKQRTIATSRCFSAGLLPVGQVPVEVRAPYDTMDPVFNLAMNFVTEEYVQDALAEIAEKGGENGMAGILADLEDEIALLMDTADIAQSETYLSGKYGDLKTGSTVITLTEGKEPSMTGPIKTATSVADAMVLQYYEETDAKKAAFGHEISEDDWRSIHSIVDTYTDMLFCSPLVCVNVAHPMLQEIRSELCAEGRKFTFLCGHDANIASVLASLHAGDYLLPDTVEQQTPIGVKLVFERWLNESGEAFWKTSLVYQSTQQMRSMSPLSLDNPPMVYPVLLPGARSGDGLIAETDLLALVDDALEAYDTLVDQYVTAEEMPDAA